MKKVLLLIVILFLSPHVLGDAISDWREKSGYYDGDPNQNTILEKGDDYIVIRNLTANSKIPLNIEGNTWWHESAEVFIMEAENHCKKNKDKRYVSNTNPTTLDDHTVLFGCYETFHSVFKKKFKNASEEVLKASANFGICSYYQTEDEKQFNARSCKKYMPIIEKLWPQANAVSRQITEHQNKYTKNRDVIYNIKKRVLANKENKQIDGDDSAVVAASSGTGFFVSTNGHMVTNNHVIEGCDVVKAHYKGRELDSDVLFTDRSNDLAIIKANIKPEKVFPVSNEDVSLLEDIIVAGYPLGKNISASIKTFKGSVTALAGFGDNYSNFQIDASLSSGNSGGPIINQKGNVVGVAVEKLVEVGVEGFNFGVKSSTLKTFASSNQIKFQDPSTEELSNKELGQLITEATIYLECWMSVAKIKLIIEEGERQKAFFSEYK